MSVRKRTQPRLGRRLQSSGDPPPFYRTNMKFVESFFEDLLSRTVQLRIRRSLVRVQVGEPSESPSAFRSSSLSSQDLIVNIALSEQKAVLPESQCFKPILDSTH
jgi:hypothetical protein